MRGATLKTRSRRAEYPASVAFSLVGTFSSSGCKRNGVRALTRCRVTPATHIQSCFNSCFSSSRRSNGVATAHCLGRDLCVLAGCEQRSRSTTRLHSLHIIRLSRHVWLFMSACYEVLLRQFCRQLRRAGRIIPRRNILISLGGEDGIQRRKHCGHICAVQ